MFVVVPPFKPSSSFTTAAPTIEMSSKIYADIEIGPTTIPTAPEAVLVQSPSIGMVYMSTISIQAPAQSQTHT